MRVKKLRPYLIIRLDPNERIIDNLLKACSSENVKLATLSGIGSVREVNLGFYDFNKKSFVKKSFSQQMEVVSLIGNVTILGKDPYIHAHISLSDKNFNCIGGHFYDGVVNATLEIILQKIDGEVLREESREIGLNVFHLPY